jgi:hypothetical protein
MVEKSTRDLLLNQEVIEMQQKPIAQMLKSKFDALVSAGFTPDQALEIVKVRGIEP